MAITTILYTLFQISTIITQYASLRVSTFIVIILATSVVWINIENSNRPVPAEAKAYRFPPQDAAGSNRSEALCRTVLR